MPGPGSTSRQCSSCCMSLNVACKTCKFCKTVQPRKLRLNKKMEKFDTKANTWVQAQKINTTSSHLRDQAALVLEKCQALGARGVLFLARPGIKKEWTCEIMMPRCNVSTDASTCLRKMEVLFEFVAKGWSHTEPAAASETPQPPAENSPATSKVHIATADTPTESSGNLSEEMYTLTLIPVPAASTYSLPSPSAASQPGKRKKGLPTERSSTPRVATSVANGCSSTTGEGMKKRNKGCRKCSRQQIFHYNGIKDRRVEKGREEVMVCWLPCASCGRKWEDTWEPASQFSQVRDTKGL